MQEETTKQDLSERLNLIEAMIAEGRRKTERWGWSFVLWGVAYGVAILWSVWGSAAMAWPVTMLAASALTIVLIARRERGKAETTIGRAVGAVWMGMGISLFLVLLSLGISGRADLHTFAAIIGGMLGTANVTSSIILRWRMQLVAALVWWVMAIIACFGSDRVTQVAFVVALFFCQIVFGVYCIVRETQKRKSGGLAHA